MACYAGDEPWKFQGALEFRSILYPKLPSSLDTHFQGTAWLNFSVQRRWEGFGKIFVSSLAEIDTHHDVARTRLIDWNERDLRHPVFRPREAYWENRFGRLDLRVGRQEIRWGRADGINPTDNLEPYDFLNPFLEERLPVTAVKGDLYLGQSHLELAWMPFYVPSRMSLLGQRWFPRLPSQAQVSGLVVPLRFREGARRYPAYTVGNSQFGVRWNHALPGIEFSFSYYDGINDLPFYTAQLISAAPSLQLQQGPAAVGWRAFDARSQIVPTVDVRLDREYHRLRVVGSDFSGTLGSWGMRGEAAYNIRSDDRDDSYLSYVFGFDRQKGRWFTIVEFAGQWTAKRGSVPQPSSFDRGLGRALLLRTQYEMRTDETLELVGLLRLPAGDSGWRLTYSRKLADGWQLELRGSAFAGNNNAFLGQFRDSGNLAAKLVYRW